MNLTGYLIDTAKLGALRLLVVADAARRAMRRRAPEILRDGAGAVASGAGDTLCVFAHFDRDHVIDDYVVYYVQRLHELGCEIVFVSTAEHLSAAEIDKVRPYCHRVLVRENVGHDFGSWKVGLATIVDLDRYRRLILANDSVYGPLHDLAGVFTAMEQTGADFWGITDSHRYRHHLQSYFLVFNGPVLRHAAFRRFWNRLPFYAFKHVVVWRGEIGLSGALQRAGFRLRAFCDYAGLRSTRREEVARLERLHWRGRPANPMFLLWRFLLQDQRCPLLKVAPLRDRPAHIPDVDDWPTVVGATSDYDTAIIRRHLARVGASEV